MIDKEKMRSKTMLFGNVCFVVGLLFLLVTSALRGAAAGAPKLMMRCRENERRALLDFKADVVDEFGILSSWGNNSINKEDDCCNWRGIRCSNRTGHVTVLNIPGRFESNGLSGKVSLSLIELKRLKYLDLSYNNFGGNIPHQLGNLTNLRSLDFRFNFFLAVENLEWLSHLRSLRHLDLSRVNLNKSSDWLQQIYKLPFLTNLILSGCRLPDSRSPPLLSFNNTSSLTSLAVVDLSVNHFISPSTYNWLFNFSTSLVSIDLTFNNFFSGSIPEAFGTIKSLETLILQICQLGGTLPLSFRNLTRLDTLDLQNNNLNGTLSEFLHPLSAIEHNSLRVLSLGHNQFTGSLPNYFTRFPSLREISINNNKLSGLFPENFGQASALVLLYLSENQITGPFPNLTLLSSLEQLYLDRNKLEDTIPETYFSNLSKLKYLDLSLNSLSLKFSFDWVPPFQLHLIRLRDCTLGPHFPNWLQSQRNFAELDISGARISDTIPLWFWDHLPPSVTYLNMSYNKIKGMLPDLSHKFDAPSFGINSNQVDIDLRSNLLEGPIPSLLVNLLFLDLAENMFTGSISFLSTTPTPYKSLWYLDLSNNQLSGHLPDCFMNFHQLAILNLGDNDLSGKIPTSIGFLNQLNILQLRNNSFIGELPSSLMNNMYLRLLDLSENKLSGVVPTWVGTHLTSVIVLSLRKNEFSGRVPLQICNLKDAHVLDLSQNNLTGNIPHCINKITSLHDKEKYGAAFLSLNDIIILQRMASSYFDIFVSNKHVAKALVQWKGQELEYKNTLGLLKLIDLSSNRLIGKIPEEVASLEGLISLNLSSNNLTGNIIQKIGQMKNLEILDLSENQLSGEIPTSLASLTFLNTLNLSKNNLTGRIPSSTQLQTFNASSYAGNDKLCGLPLPSKCPGQETDVLPSPPGGHGKEENNEEDDDKFTKIGLYVSVVLGFATGFWGFLGPILLQSTWRRAYFRMLGKIADWIYVTTTINMARMQRKIFS